MKELYHPSKKEFQLERIILFSDAVFAIAITLLVIDIKVPDISGMSISDESFWIKSEPTILKLFSFLISFAVIALYWVEHHKLFGFVTKQSGKLIFLNFLFLFGIVIMPYTTAVYSEYSIEQYAFLLLPFSWYVLNIVLCGVSLRLLWNYIGNPKNEVSDFIFDKVYLTKVKKMVLILPVVFIISFILSWTLHSPVGRFFLFTIPLWFWIMRHKTKKDKPLKSHIQHHPK